MIRQRMFLLLFFVGLAIMAGFCSPAYSQTTGITPEQLQIQPPPFDVQVGTKRATLIIDNRFYQIRLGPSFVFTLDGQGEIVMDITAPPPAPTTPVFQTFSQVLTANETTTLTFTAGPISVPSLRFYRNGILQTNGVDFDLTAGTGIVTMRAGVKLKKNDVITAFWLVP